MSRITLLFVLLCVPMSAYADVVSVAVASNFKDTLKQLADRFEAETGHTVQLSPASTGKHYAQIMHGAPFHVFFSADAERPALLEQSGFAVAGTRFVFARGKLTLWAPAMTGMACEAALASAAFKRLAIANPKTAPYGVAAESVLTTLQLLPGYSGRIVMGENISQTMQFVDSSAADAAFVATALWQVHPRREQGCHWHVPAELAAPLDQEAVLLKRGEHSVAARAFLDFVRTPAARSLVAAAGYDLPY